MGLGFIDKITEKVVDVVAIVEVFLDSAHQPYFVKVAEAEGGFNHVARHCWGYHWLYARKGLEA